ncbi:hypothetical protein SLS63_002611 [Diaporthe eres]|uniref:Uncharacterized protein n=1 Tax=Diaporthe eres TaxID=83184 RepID=A0ABR1PK71_DIAER
MQLVVVHHDAVAVVRRIEPSTGLKPFYTISTWTMAMKLICVHEITQLRFKTTPEHQLDEYWVFEWLKTCASTGDLPPDQKLANQRRWIDSDNASVGVIEDTANRLNNNRIGVLLKKRVEVRVVTSLVGSLTELARNAQGFILIHNQMQELRTQQVEILFNGV